MRVMVAFLEGKGPAVGLVLAMVLAGCLDAELTDPLVHLELVEARKDGNCTHHFIDDRCDEVTIRLINNNTKKDASTNQLHWDGVDQDGGVHEVLRTRGPSAVVAGGAASITIEFDIPSDTELVSVRYKSFWMEDHVMVPLTYDED